MTRPTLSAVVRVAHVDLDMVRTIEAAAAVAADVVILLGEPPDPRARPMLDGLARRHGARLVVSAAGTAGRDNRAVQATSGDAVLLLEPGDRVFPAVVAELAADVHAGVAVAAAPIRVTRAFGGAHVHTPPEAAALALLTEPDAVPTAYVLSRRAFEALGGFDEGLGVLADADLWVRALARGGVRIGSRPLLDRPLADAAPVSREAADAFYRKHATALEADPSRVLGALERRMAALAAAHEPALARRAAGVAELLALDTEIAALEGELRGLGRHIVDWGDFRRLSPISREWGYDRGTPVDRPYIEAFLASHADDVQGVVLEVQEADYTTRFGGDRVTRSEVVDVDASNPRATVLADLRHADALASAAYDCFILTQTLHVVDDIRQAVAEAFRVLKPGGVLLATFPAASRVCVEYGAAGDFWRVTEAGARALLETVFPPDAVSVHAYGNVMTTTAFLHGLGAHELTGDEQAAYDHFFPLLVGVRARKPLAGESEDAPRTARRTGLPAAPAGAVLLFHRVGDPTPDVHGLSIPAAPFRALLEMLRTAYEVVPLAELRRWIGSGRDPAGLVALTFDDGYLDNLALASPILAELELPATFFVTTEHADQAGEYWWDTLERVLLAERPVPAVIDLNGSRPAERMDTSSAAGRRRAHDALHRRLVVAPLDERRATMARLLEWSGRPVAPLGGRPMLADEIRVLAGRPGHEIGGHGVHHLALGSQPASVVRAEVDDAVRRLGEILGRDVTAFAYPYGDVSEAAVEAVGAAGLRTAVTCVEGGVRKDADPLRLPRIEVKAEAPGALAERLWRLLR